MLSTVCIGETMAMLTPVDRVPLHLAANLHCSVGGAESNVALGLAAMGLDAHWVGRVGNDGFGVKIIDQLSNAGVGVGAVQVDPDLSTGMYVKFQTEKRSSGSASSVLYYRLNSAASAMSPDMLRDPEVAHLLDHASLIHVSGITPALSESCRALIEALLAAPRNGRLVSFDVNWRTALWADQDHSVVRRLANLADIVLVGRDEAKYAFGTTDPNQIRTLLPDPTTVVIKNDSINAIALGKAGSNTDVPALTVEVLEPVGAGDSFAAGYLSGVLLGLDTKTSLRRGHVAAACTLTVHGDRGPLPEDDELNALLECNEAEWAAIHVSNGKFNASQETEES